MYSCRRIRVSTGWNLLKWEKCFPIFVWLHRKENSIWGDERTEVSVLFIAAPKEIVSKWKSFSRVKSNDKIKSKDLASAKRIFMQSFGFSYLPETKIFSWMRSKIIIFHLKILWRTNGFSTSVSIYPNFSSKADETKNCSQLIQL